MRAVANFMAGECASSTVTLYAHAGSNAPTQKHLHSRNIEPTEDDNQSVYNNRWSSNQSDDEDQHIPNSPPSARPAGQGNRRIPPIQHDARIYRGRELCIRPGHAFESLDDVSGCF